MKKSILCIIILSIGYASYSQWFQHQNIPVTSNLVEVTFPDPGHGWIVGSEGTIIHSGDGGNTWIVQNYESSAHFSAISMAGNLHGWVVGQSGDITGLILRTNDGGTTWERTDTSDHYLTDVCFIDSLKGWVVGENTDAGAPGLLKITVDGGDTWTDLLLPEIMFPGEVVFANSRVGYIGGTHHDWSHFRLKVLKTTDGGMTWSTFADMGSDGDMFFGDMMFRDSVTSWFMGDYYAIQIHGGETHNGFIVRIENLYDWIYNDSWRPRALYFTSPDSGWAVGQSGLFMDTRDNGDHWTIQYLPPGNAMNDITFTDNFHGWAVGNTGTVMYTENNGYTAIAENPGRQSKDPGLHIFPNPAKDLVEIHFEMSSAGRVNLQLYSISGQRIRQYDTGFFPEGRRSINFSPENLPPGIYIVRLFMGKKTMTGRLAIR